MIRPSNVLGGRAMATVYNSEELEQYLKDNGSVLMDGPILVDRFLSDAIEVDVDAICDGEEVYIAGIMEHIERAGIHSGDSACVLPPYSLSQRILEEMKDSTQKLAMALKTIGPINIQYAVKDETLYIIEVNPRASRTIPFVAKATGIPVAKICSSVVVGKKLKEFKLSSAPVPKRFAVKEVVLPFARFADCDTLLGPEMKSTGESMGHDAILSHAFAKAQAGAFNFIPSEKSRGLAAVTCIPQKEQESTISNRLKALGFKVLTVNEDNLDKEKEVIQKGDFDLAFIFNRNPSLKNIRRSIVMNRIPYFSTYEAAIHALSAMEESSTKQASSVSIQSLSQ